MKIHSVYESISGEVSYIPQGSFVTIIRLSKCNCSCNWCDAPDARDDNLGKYYTSKMLVEKIKQFNNPNLLITGGEPLLQIDEINNFLEELSDNEPEENPIDKIIVETNGTIDPSTTPFFNEVYFVIDFKLPSSGCFEQMNLDNYMNLMEFDYIKFVCNDKYDVKLAIKVSQILKSKGCEANMAIGQTWEWLQKKDFNLFKYLVENNAKHFVINFQLHKFLNLE